MQDDLIRSLAIDPQTPTTLYVGTYNHIFKSIDGGSNWLRLPYYPGLVPAIDFYRIEIDPISPSILYVLSRDGVYKSIDGGDIWQSINTRVDSAKNDPSKGGDVGPEYAGRTEKFSLCHNGMLFVTISSSFCFPASIKAYLVVLLAIRDTQVLP